MGEPQAQPSPTGACVYGAPPAELVSVPDDAVQTSPTIPGSRALDSLPPGGLSSAIIAAPAGTLERNAVLALALRALRPDGRLTAIALKDRGGARLAGTLAAFGCTVEETSRRHHRICHLTRPAMLTGVQDAIIAGAPRLVDAVGWTQPGLFSWDRRDRGSVLLAGALGSLAGRGADLGCGGGLLAEAVLAQAAVTALHLVDLDRRAIDMARRNVIDPRAILQWADAREPLGFGELDFVVTNPPFHHSGREDQELGRAFITAGRALLRKGGVFWLVANRHLPYEEILNTLFASVSLRVQDGGFKIYEARR